MDKMPNQMEMIKRINVARKYPGYHLLLARDYLEKYSDSYISNYLYAQALGDLYRYEDAIKVLEKSITLSDFDVVSGFFNIGLLYAGKKEFQTAIDYFKKCIEIKPERADYYSNTAMAFIRMGMFDKAEEYYQKAIQCTDGYVDEAYLNYGYLFRAQERFPDALDAFKKAIELDPEYEKAHLAIKDIGLAIDLKSNDQFLKTETKQDRIVAINRSGDFPAFRLLMARALVRDCPDYGPAYIKYASSLKELVRFEEAKAVLDYGFKYFPKDKKYYFYLHMGYLYDYKGDFDKAVYYFQKCIKEGHNEEALTSIGLVLFYEGNKCAEEYCRKALQYSKGCDKAEALFNLGLVLRSYENFSEASNYFKEVFAMKQNYLEVKNAIEDMDYIKMYLQNKNSSML